MGVKLAGAVYVFVPFSDRPLNDPALRRDAHHVREFLVSILPGADLVVDCKGCRDFRLLPVDGYGRTFKTSVTPDGSLPADLWITFAESSPQISQLPSGREDQQTRESPLPMAQYAIEADDKTVRLIRGSDEIPPESISDTWSNHLEGDARALQVRWAEPFAALFPAAAALEAVEYWGQLSTVLALSAAGRVGQALARAETLLGPLSEPVTVRSTVDFWEVFAQHDGPEAVLFEASVHGVEEESCSALVKSERFQSHVQDPVTLPYLHGIVGFLAQQAVNYLRAGHVPRRCEHCLRVLPRGAPANRRLCRPEENRECSRSMNAQRARKLRRV